MNAKKISFIIPTETNPDAILSLLLVIKLTLDEVISTARDKDNGTMYEVIFVVNTDQITLDAHQREILSWKEAKIICISDKEESQVCAGIRYASGDVIVILDPQKTMCVFAIRKLINNVRDGFNVAAITSTAHINSIVTTKRNSIMNSIDKLLLKDAFKNTSISHIEDYNSSTQAFPARYAKVVAMHRPLFKSMAPLERLLVFISCGGLVVEVPARFNPESLNYKKSIKELLSAISMIKKIKTHYQNGKYRVSYKRNIITGDE